MKSILVFGSINIDLVTKTPRLPVAGETLQGSEFFTAPGGKGANQAAPILQQRGVKTAILTEIMGFKPPPAIGTFEFSGYSLS